MKKIVIKNRKFVIGYAFFNIHDCSNGAAKYVIEQERECNNAGISYVYFFFINNYFRPEVDPKIYMYGVYVDGVFWGVYSIEQFGQEIERLSREKSLVAFNIHHLKQAQLTHIKRLVASMPSVKVYLYLHDYFLLCNNYNLYLPDEGYCGDGGWKKERCSQCVYYEQSKERLEETEKWLTGFQDRLVIVSPSECTKKKWGVTYPELLRYVQVIPHKKLKCYSKSRESVGKKIRIGFLGRPIEIKGWKAWCKLVNDIGDNSNFEFYTFSNQKSDIRNVKYVYVNNNKDNMHAMQDMLRKYKIDICFLWSLVPETFSYTCVESREVGAYIVTNDNAGNIADVVRENECGKVYSNLEFFEEDLLFRDGDEIRNQLLDYLNNEEGKYKYSENNLQLIQEFSENLPGRINWETKESFEGVFSFGANIYLRGVMLVKRILLKIKEINGNKKN